MPYEYETINYYDDDHHNYVDFWVGRDYEHESEILAINKLLKNKRYTKTLDYGGGYGRLAKDLLRFSDFLYLADPSVKQLNIGKSKLKGVSNVDYIKLVEEGKIPLEDNSLDLLVMVRVSHHLVDPTPTFKEIYRVLEPGGQAIIEIANYAHMVHRIKHYLKLKKLPTEPVQVGEVANGITDSTPFVNHNPKTIEKQFKQSRLEVVKIISVSNLRSAKLKKIFGIKLLLKIDNLMQNTLSSTYFGPSIFYLVEKKPTSKK